MRNISWMLISVLILTLSACGGSGGEQSEESTEQEQVQLPEVLQRGTTTIDLSEYFMPFSLIIPDSMRGYPEVVETGYGETQLVVGSTYNVVMYEGGDMAEFKSQLEGDIMYTNTVIEEGEGFVLYKSEIADSFLEPEFHFYAVKSVNGGMYEFHDFNEEGGYAESVARFMLESVNNLIPNNEAS